MTAEIFDFPKFPDGYEAAREIDRLEHEICRFMEIHDWSDDDPEIADLKTALDRVIGESERIQSAKWQAEFRKYSQWKREWQATFPLGGPP